MQIDTGDECVQELLGSLPAYFDDHLTLIVMMDAELIKLRREREFLLSFTKGIATNINSMLEGELTNG